MAEPGTSACLSRRTGLLDGPLQLLAALLRQGPESPASGAVTHSSLPENVTNLLESATQGSWPALQHISPHGLLALLEVSLHIFTKRVCRCISTLRGPHQAVWLGHCTPPDISCSLSSSALPKTVSALDLAPSCNARQLQCVKWPPVMYTADI